MNTGKKVMGALAFLGLLFCLGAAWKVGQSVYVIGDEVVSVGGVRQDSRATLADADGEYTALQLTANGDLRTRDDDAISALGTLTSAPVEKSWVMGGALVADGPAPAPLAADETFARKVVMTAVQADGTANTGIVYIGDANLVDTSAACIQLAPGDSFTLEGSPGTKFDLHLLYVDGGTAADGVRYLYQPL